MEVTETNKQLQDSLNIIGNFKQQADLIAADCLSIKITDEITLAIGQQNLSKANQLVKSIEDKRKLIKQPYLDAGKKIDEFCKTLSESLVKSLEHIKSEVKGWEDARREKERKRQETLDYINGELSNRLKELCDSAGTKEKCEEVITYINTKFPKDEKFGEFIGQAHALRDMYLQLITLKRDGFANGLELPSDSIEKGIEDIKKYNETTAEVVAQTAAASKTRGIRETWKFELAAIHHVPLEWLCLDEAKVKAYLAENKDTLRDGGVVNGVKFFKEIGVVA